MSGRLRAAAAITRLSMFALLVLGGVAVAVAAAAPAEARSGAAQSGVERISGYDVAMVVEPSGDLLVTEVIDYDFGFQDRHGIFRDIPVRLYFDDRYDRVYPLRVESVEGSEGTPDQYTLEDVGSLKRIKIGDPDRTISGAHRYTIVYRVEGALNGFDTHDELYWNAVGDGWSVPVERPTVSVQSPGPLTEVACFSGPTGSTLPCDGSSTDGSRASFREDSLAPGEAFTVVVGFQKGFVPEPAPVLDERWTFARAFAATPATVATSAGLFAVVAGGFGYLLWSQGRDRRWVGSAVDVAFGSETGQHQPVGLFEREPTPVEFVPPDELRPGQVGTLVDEVAHPLDVTATIIDLAVRGYLRIEEIPKKGLFGRKDWELHKQKESSGLRPYEASLFASLFRGRKDVKLSELKNTFASSLKKVQDALYDDAVAHGWFARRPDRTRTLWIAVGVGALAAGVGVTVLVAAFTHWGLVGLPLVAGGVMMLAGAKRMPRRTAKGTGTLRRVLGFRRFIEESEKERARFAEQKNLFSEYLPYAVVFGCTEKWARAFADLDGRLPETNWYTGPTHFHVDSFSDSINGFSTTTSGTITSTPSGSGSSGFGGGGFSGGGGGGGGGGSW